MGKYVKKPIVVEAMQWKGKEDEISYPVWFYEARLMNLIVYAHESGLDDILMIQTLNGKMLCARGEWIIKGAFGEIYPIKDEVFKETYMEADE